MKTITRTIAALALATTTVVAGATATPAAQEGPNLACATVEDCHNVIDQIWPQFQQLGAEVNDLRVIRDAAARKADRKIARKDARIALLQEKLERARANR